ncbi:MAG: carbonic anhydrase [Phycisphaerales bacterium]
MPVIESPESALAVLAEGNARFASGHPQHPNTSRAHTARSLTDPPTPVAIVLSCIDSRVPVERVFDLGVGDLFVVRVAGNVATTGVVGSIELALGSGCPVIVVMGHTGCLAVGTACAGGLRSRAVRSLTGPIREEAERVRMMTPGIGDEEFLRHVEQANVHRSMADLMNASDDVRSAVETGRVALVGAVYETDAGRVRWLNG